MAEGEEESDYDLNAESDKEEVKKAPSKKQETHKSQLDEYLSKLAYQAPSRASNKMKYVEPESDEEEEQEPKRHILPAPKSANKKEAAAAGPSGRTRSTRVASKDEKMEIDQEESNDEDKPLHGKKIVVSGEFESISRKKLEELIEQLGGQKMSGVSSRTHYLVVGYKLEDGRQVTQGSKYANAKKHGTTILTELEFEKLI